MNNEYTKKLNNVSEIFASLKYAVNQISYIWDDPEIKDIISAADESFPFEDKFSDVSDVIDEWCINVIENVEDKIEEAMNFEEKPDYPRCFSDAFGFGHDDDDDEYDDDEYDDDEYDDDEYDDDECEDDEYSDDPEAVVVIAFPEQFRCGGEEKQKTEFPDLHQIPTEVLMEVLKTGLMPAAITEIIVSELERRNLEKDRMFKEFIMRNFLGL